MPSKPQQIVMVVNGLIEDYRWAYEQAEKGQYLIGVDGGNNHIYRMGLVPDLIVGDLDSIHRQARYDFESKDIPFLTYPSQKDQSDLQIALEHAASMTPKEIVLLGALGNRFDHAFGNVVLMTSLEEQGIPVVLMDETHFIRIITRSLEIKQAVGDALSLFSLTPRASGITTQGLYYPLNDETLFFGDTRGLSNEIMDPDAKVTLKEGRLLTIRVKGKVDLE